MEKFFTENQVTAIYSFPGDSRAIMGSARATKWVECDTCKDPIERLAGLANKTFTCYDCRAEKMRIRAKAQRAKKKNHG